MRNGGGLFGKTDGAVTRGKYIKKVQGTPSGHNPILTGVSWNTEGKKVNGQGVFLRGAVILAAASAVSRVIGLAYMVVLPGSFMPTVWGYINW